MQRGCQKDHCSAISKGRDYLREGSYKKAAAYFKRISKEYPIETASRFYAAFSNILAGDMDSWRTERSELVDLKAPIAAIRYIDGFRSAQLGKPRTAVSSYRDSLRIEKTPEVYHDLSVALHKMNNYQGAIEAAKSGLKVDSKNAFLMVALADALQYDGQQKEAAGWYQRAIAENSKMPQPYSALCAALVNRGDYQEAIQYCEKGKKLDSGDGPAYFNLGKAYKALGNYEKARSNYSQYVKMFESKMPNDQFVLEAKSEISVANRVIASRKGSSYKPKAPGAFTTKENGLLEEIEDAYARLMGPKEARSVVDNMRKLWATIPSDQRMPLIMSTRNQLVRR